MACKSSVGPHFSLLLPSCTQWAEINGEAHRIDNRIRLPFVILSMLRFCGVQRWRKIALAVHWLPEHNVPTAKVRA